MVNASLRSYIIYYDQSGLLRPNHKGKRGENDNIHKYVINVNKAMTLKRRIFNGSNAYGIIWWIKPL
jgi:hypothetical protein